MTPAADDFEGELITDLHVLDAGDSVLWGDRVEPLTVVKTALGSHVTVEGPRGGTYTLWPSPQYTDADFHSENDGPARNLRRVDTAPADGGGRIEGFHPGTTYRDGDA